jgi:membrane-associated protease RseP (regulator of RpoE activity)
MLGTLMGLCGLVSWVVVHELGHMLMAKAFGLKVPLFSVGLGPALFKFQLGSTEYRLSLLPIGGYVRIPSLDIIPSDEEEQEEASLLAQACVLLAGPGANLLAALAGLSFLRHSFFDALRILIKVPEIIFQSFAQADRMQGPVGIVHSMAQASSQDGWLGFCQYMVALSLGMFFFNMLPLPVLDGGRLSMVLYHVVLGKKVPTNVQLGLQLVGVVGFLAFFIYTVVSDIRHL